jgi:uncharacterized protein (TIGR03435 family)
MRFAHASVVAIFSAAVFGQAPSTPPAFDLADVHTSPHAMNLFMQGGVIRGGKFTIKNATMVDLITTAYGVEADFVLGGPSWLETDRFDVNAKAPAATSQDEAKLMLRTLLAERFKLVLHNDSKPTQAFVLSAGKGKPKLKEADGSGATGCQGQSQPPSQSGVFNYIVVACRNMTMEAFATSIHQMAGGYLTSPVVNQTGIKGSWDFDIKWSGRGVLAAMGADGISIFDAVDRELGLKLELQKVPTPVIVVDSANQKPTANPPGVTTALPPAAPAEFEVADIKPSAPGANPGGGGFMPGGRIDLRGIPLQGIISIAWNLPPGEDLIGAPKWLQGDSPRFDLVAKVSTTIGGPANGPPVDIEDLRVMLQALLKERFKLETHFEDRPVPVYTLLANKPKLKKADPSNRSKCKSGPAPIAKDAPAPTGPPPFQATCQNMTMAQFVAQLTDIAPVYIHYPAADGTGIEGAWDFSFTFSPVPPAMMNGFGGGEQGRKGGPPQTGAGPSSGAVPTASDPIGGISLFDALDKQLGLKLEMRKSPMPVLVIDHIEPKPTEN